MTNAELEQLARECGAVQDLRAGEWRFNQHRLREFARRSAEAARVVDKVAVDVELGAVENRCTKV